MATRTTRDHGDVLLVGSIARLDDDWTVEDVFRRSAAALGDHVTMLPDGELGDRSQWITFIARHTYYGHPDLETRSRHTYDDWLPKGYDDQWRFAVREGVDEIRFERIGYAAEAERSYEIFRRLRDEGAIPEGMRFLVAYPLTESAVRAFVNEPRDYEIIWRAYNDAVRRELEHLGTVIAPEDLAIQWDLARETAMIENVGFNFDDAGLTSLPNGPDGALPAGAVGAVAVGPRGRVAGPARLLRLAAARGGRVARQRALHADPRPRDGGRDAQPRRRRLRPPRRLRPHAGAARRPARRALRPARRPRRGDARVYLGLLDVSDGLEGALARAEIARRHLSDFGVGTPCGWAGGPRRSGSRTCWRSTPRWPRRSPGSSAAGEYVA